MELPGPHESDREARVRSENSIVIRRLSDIHGSESQDGHYGRSDRRGIDHDHAEAFAAAQRPTPALIGRPESPARCPGKLSVGSERDLGFWYPTATRLISSLLSDSSSVTTAAYASEHKSVSLFTWLSPSGGLFDRSLEAASSGSDTQLAFWRFASRVGGAVPDAVVDDVHE